MYKLNELAFEAMLENSKQAYSGNHFMKLAIDKLSYEYNRVQYNDCLQHINDENNQIADIYNQISLRGGYATQYEHQELQRHIQLSSEYEAKSMKHFLSGDNVAENIANNIVQAF